MKSYYDFFRLKKNTGQWKKREPKKKYGERRRPVKQERTLEVETPEVEVDAAIIGEL